MLLVVVGQPVSFLEACKLSLTCLNLLVGIMAILTTSSAITISRSAHQPIHTVFHIFMGNHLSSSSSNRKHRKHRHTMAAPLSMDMLELDHTNLFLMEVINLSLIHI